MRHVAHLRQQDLAPRRQLNQQVQVLVNLVADLFDRLGLGSLSSTMVGQDSLVAHLIQQCIEFLDGEQLE